MSHSNKKPVAIGAALVSGLILSGSAFAMQPMASGYMLATTAASVAGDKVAAEGSCGGDKAKAEGKCGEGKCGAKAISMMDTDKDGKVSRAECAAHHDAEFTKADADKDGFVTAAEADAAMKAMHEGKCGEGKCGGEKKAEGEGKCGEGKCGGEQKEG